MPVTQSAGGGGGGVGGGGPLGAGEEGQGLSLAVVAEIERLRQDLYATTQALEDLRVKYNAHTHTGASHTHTGPSHGHTENQEASYTQNVQTALGGSGATGATASGASAGPPAGSQSTVVLLTG